MSEKIRVDSNRGKCAKVKAAGAPQLRENTGAGHRWTRFIIAAHRTLRSAKVDSTMSAPSATAGRGYANP